MPDVSYGSIPMSSNSDAPQTDKPCADTVCINANRIYDSCGSKDCLHDLNVYFTQANQCIINNASSVRICKASVITATVDVEPVAFHRGFYAVDVTFFFDIALEVYASGCSIPQTVNGLAIYGKRVVLYGSEGSSKTFSSDEKVKCEEHKSGCVCHGFAPKATVQISQPMALSAKLFENRCPKMPNVSIPECVCDYFCDSFVPSTEKGVSVTIGIFTITQLERKVQLVIPSYDFCIPRKECSQKSDDPCEVFSKVEFPSDSFFPPNAREDEKQRYSFECECND